MVRIGWMSNMGLISWYRDVWCRYFYGMTYDEYVECEEEPKTYIDVNGNKYDMSKHDFMKDWIVREREVESKLREEIRRNKVTFGDVLRKTAMSTLEENRENRERVIKEFKANYNHAAEIVFDVMKGRLFKQAKDGYLCYGVPFEEIENILISKHCYYVEEYYLVEALNKLAETMGLKVRTKKYSETFPLVPILSWRDYANRKDDETMVIFEW